VKTQQKLLAYTGCPGEGQGLVCPEFFVGSDYGLQRGWIMAQSGWHARVRTWTIIVAITAVVLGAWATRQLLDHYALFVQAAITDHVKNQLVRYVVGSEVQVEWGAVRAYPWGMVSFHDVGLDFGTRVHIDSLQVRFSLTALWRHRAAPVEAVESMQASGVRIHLPPDAGLVIKSPGSLGSGKITGCENDCDDPGQASAAPGEAPTGVDRLQPWLRSLSRMAGEILVRNLVIDGGGLRTEVRVSSGRIVLGRSRAMHVDIRGDVQPDIVGSFRISGEVGSIHDPSPGSTPLRLETEVSSVDPRLLRDIAGNWLTGIRDETLDLVGFAGEMDVRASVLGSLAVPVITGRVQRGQLRLLDKYLPWEGHFQYRDAEIKYNLKLMNTDGARIASGSGNMSMADQKGQLTIRLEPQLAEPLAAHLSSGLMDRANRVVASLSFEKNGQGGHPLTVGISCDGVRVAGIDEIAVSASVDVNDTGFKINQFNMNSPSGSLEISGQLGYDGRLDAGVRVDSLIWEHVLADWTGIHVHGRGDFDGRLTGTVADPVLSGQVIMQDGQLWEVEFSYLQAEIEMRKDCFKLNDLIADSGWARYSGEGKVSFGSVPVLDLEFKGQHVDGMTAAGWFGWRGELAGLIGGTVFVRGEAGDLIIGGRIAGEGVSIYGREVEEGMLDFDHRRGLFCVRRFSASSGEGYLRAEGTVDYADSIDLKLETINLPLQYLFAFPEDKLPGELFSGYVSMAATITGSTGRPRIRGDARVSGPGGTLYVLNGVEGSFDTRTGTFTLDSIQFHSQADS